MQLNLIELSPMDTLEVSGYFANGVFYNQFVDFQNPFKICEIFSVNYMLYTYIHIFLFYIFMEES
jgi:hypothetical protein